MTCDGSVSCVYRQGAGTVQMGSDSLVEPCSCVLAVMLLFLVRTLFVDLASQRAYRITLPSSLHCSNAHEVAGSCHARWSGLTATRSEVNSTGKLLSDKLLSGKLLSGKLRSGTYCLATYCLASKALPRLVFEFPPKMFTRKCFISVRISV